MDREPDQALVERLRRGDGAAFRQLVLKYQRPLYNAAYRVLGREEDARDITQVVFLRITQRLDGYDARYKFFSWLYRIALNESLNLLRRAGREEPLADDADETVIGESADPEMTRRGVVERIQSREFKDVLFVHEVTNFGDGHMTVDDVTGDIFAEAGVEPVAA